MAMMTSMPSTPAPRTKAAARILTYARRRAGLTQRALAEKSGVPQETIARIESTRQSPRFDTLVHLLNVCGFELEVEAKKGIGVDKSLIDSMLSRDQVTRARSASASNDLNIRMMRSVRRVAE